jgi:hypothetical protein
MKLDSILAELIAERDRLDVAIKALGGLIGTEKSASKPTTSKPRRKMSAAARKRISAAQKARWAKQKAQQKKSVEK